MARQLSTALSEVLLFCFTAFLSYNIYDQSKLIAAAVAACASSAFVGIFRYGLASSSYEVYRWHHFTTKIALCFTPALIASSYVAKVHTLGSMAFFVAPIVVAFVMTDLAPDSQEVFMTLLSGAALCSILYVSFIENIVSGLIGAGLMVVASILAQSDGQVGGIRRVDLFHILLIPSIYFLINGLLNI